MNLVDIGIISECWRFRYHDNILGVGQMFGKWPSAKYATYLCRKNFENKFTRNPTLYDIRKPFGKNGLIEILQNAIYCICAPVSPLTVYHWKEREKVFNRIYRSHIYVYELYNIYRYYVCYEHVKTRIHAPYKWAGDTRETFWLTGSVLSVSGVKRGRQRRRRRGGGATGRRSVTITLRQYVHACIVV